MKILIYMIREKGGVGRVVATTKKELERRGHEVEVISREDDLDWYSTKDSWRLIRKMVKKMDYDILYTQDWSCALPFLFFKNHYCCFHGLEDSSPFLQYFVGKIMGGRLVVVSDRFKNNFPKSSVIYNCVDDELFFDMKKERKYFGWMERPYQTDYSEEEKLAKIEGLRTSVAVGIPPEKMNEWYNKLKVFASFPPEYAGFNLSWLEAIKAGVPIVYGNNYGIGIHNLKKNIDEFCPERQMTKLINLFSGLRNL